LAQYPIGAAAPCAMAGWLLITPSITHTKARSALEEKVLRTLFIF
jgi:hypothetical protein